MLFIIKEYKDIEPPCFQIKEKIEDAQKSLE